MLKRAVRLLFSRSCTGQRSAAADAAAGLAQLTRHLADLRTLLREQYQLCRQCDDSLARIEDAAGCAWDERTLLRSDYSRLLRGILNVLDDWHTGAANGASHEVVSEGLVRLLRDHQVTSTSVEAGQSFQPDLHCCESVTDQPDRPPGTVIEVLEQGYVRRCPNGTREVIRPARVIVNRDPTSSEVG